VLPTILTTLVFGCGILAWTWILGHRRNGGQLLSLEPHVVVPWDAFDLLALVIIYVFVTEVCLNLGARWSGISIPALGEKPGPDFELLMVRCNLAISAITILGSVAFIHFRVGATATDFGLNIDHLPKDIWTGAVAFVAIAPAVYLIQEIGTLLIPYEHPLIDELQHKPDASTQWIAVISALIVAPIFEEFLFRGILQGWLEKMELRLVANLHNRGDATLNNQPSNASSEQLSISGLKLGTIPIFISSMLFALIHLGQGAAPIALYVFALALGYLYRQTHRLWPSMTVHFLLNAVTLVAVLTGERG
jgi:membrane protease YdiL (CAAX protease family)